MAPRQFKAAFDELFPDFKKGQQDAHEFLRRLLAELDRDSINLVSASEPFMQP